MSAIELIVGLGNPGPDYAKTRHNAGVWFVQHLCDKYNISLKSEPKLKASVGQGTIKNLPVKVAIPHTFMNHSGEAVHLIVQYYKIPPASLLVVYDELDLEPGSVRLKKDGGHGGHNGMRDIIQKLHTAEFNRLRLGIGHPGQRDKVVDYVLKAPNKEDKSKIEKSIEEVLEMFPEILTGNFDAAMNYLHQDK